MKKGTANDPLDVRDIIAENEENSRKEHRLMTLIYILSFIAFSLFLWMIVLLISLFV
jgi:hypothetical protein